MSGQGGDPPIRRLRVADLAGFEIPETPTISPDGSTVVYVLRTVELAEDRYQHALWQLDVDGGEPRQLTHDASSSAPAFSPDGRWLAFVRDADGTAQLWLLPTAGGEAEQLTDLPLGAGAPRWSPDGRRIAFIAPVDLAADGRSAPDAAKRRRSAPIVTDRLEYFADGGGAFGSVRVHLHVLDLAERTVRQLTRGDWHAGDPVWSPDGGRLAFGAARTPDRDRTADAGVYVTSVDDPDEPARLGPAPAALTPVIWGKDEQTVYAVGTIVAPNAPAGLFRLRGDEVVSMTHRLDRNVLLGGPAYPGGWPQLSSDASSVLFCARDAGRTRLYRAGVDNGEVTAIDIGDDTVVAGLSVAAQAPRAAVVLAGRESFGEIAIVDLDRGTVRARTEYGRRSLPDIELFPKVERRFGISDGTTITGWLTRDERRAGPAPLLLDIHGGPHNAWNAAADDVHLYHQVLASRGWCVLTVNSRGSDGYGTAFFSALDTAWGTADHADFVEPIDELIAAGIADPDRLAVTGYSYGGFATCYLTGHDNRFAAAVAGGIVCDLTSMAGTSDAGHYIAQFEIGGTPPELPDRYATLSPINSVRRVTTPTLVLHGQADERCPIGQAQQWFSALRVRDVPTRLVLYPGASHLFPVTGRPSHRIDYNRRVLAWLEHYVGSGPLPEADELHRLLVDAAERHSVPGAVAGIVRLRGADAEADQVVATHGVLSTDTGIEVTADSLFQIGSISKPWTATLVMRLVDEGRVGLDTPVAEVLPELRLGGEQARASVTLRQLLTHTSGIDGDIFTDTGEGDEALQRYVALLAEAAQLFPAGATFSYSNAGYAILGRIVEVLTGETFEQALRERLIEPLGLTHTTLSPGEAIRHRVATGHFADDGAPQATTTWALPRATTAAGRVICSIGDLLRFAELHLRGGMTSDGVRLLSTDATAAMAQHQVAIPQPVSLVRSWGLGWARHDWDDTTLIGHDGATIGQSAYLLMSPAHGVAVALLTNAADTADVYREVVGAAFAELTGLTMPAPPQPPQPPQPAVPHGEHVGRYRRASLTYDVSACDGLLTLRAELDGPLAELLPDEPTELPLVRCGGDRYLFREPGDRVWTAVNFVTLPDGSHYLFTGGRATPKVG